MHRIEFNNTIISHGRFLAGSRLVCVVLIFMLTIMLTNLYSCKKISNSLEWKPDVSKLPLVQLNGKKLPADIDISDLLIVWAKAIPSKDAPQFQSTFDAVPRIVHEFSKAGKPMLSSGGSQLWFGFMYIIPAVGKPGGGWHIMRIQKPEDSFDDRGRESLKKLKLINENAVTSLVVFHTEYRSRDWEFVKKLVEGRSIADDHPFVQDLRKLRGGGAYPLLSTAGTSFVVIHDKPFVDPTYMTNVPLYLRQKGNRMFGIQRTKSGNPNLPFEHITGIYYEFWRVR